MTFYEFITITPSSIVATPGVTVQFSASTVCNGDSVDGTYSWEIMEMGSTGRTGSTINNKGLYTAGSTVGTDTVKVTDNINGDASATARVVVKSCAPSVSISPSSASVKYTETQQFNAITICNGDALPATYSWEVSGSAGGKIDAIDSSSALYTAGSTVGTDTVEVTDTTNGNISATAQIVIESSLSIVVSPDSMLRSRWIILPYLMTIEGTDTNFVISSTKVSFTPAGSILGTPPLILDAESILQLTFVNSSLFLAWTEDETVTVTVTTGTEVATDAVAIEMLPFPLDEQKNIK